MLTNIQWACGSAIALLTLIFSPTLGAALFSIAVLAIIMFVRE